MIHREDVLAIYDEARHVISGRLGGNIGRRERYGSGRGGGVEVVFADVDRWQVPESGHVKGFVKRALIGGPLTEKSDGHLTCSTVFGRKSRAGGDGDLSAHDSVASNQSEFGTEDMHGASASAAVPAFPPH